MIKKKLKIIYLINTLNVGGAEKVVVNLADNMNSDHYDITIITLKNEIELFKTIEKKTNIKLVTLNIPQMKFPWIDISTIYNLYKVVNEIKPDLIHLHLYSVQLINILGLIFIRNRIKYVTTIHNSGLHYNPTKPIEYYFLYVERIILRLFKAEVIVISSEVERIVKKNLRIKRTNLIYNGVDTEKFKKLPQLNKSIDGYKFNDSDILVVHVGRYGKQKGQDFLIEAIPHVINKFINIKFLFIGRDLKEHYSERVKVLKIEKYVLFLGVRYDLVELLSVSDIAVLPSLFEGLPIALLEKMSMSLPCVLTDISPFQEISCLGENAILVPVNDHLGIAKALVRLIENQGERYSLGQKSRKHIIKKYSLNTHTEEHNKLYHNIINVK